ncbi:glycosyltransferase [Piscinibacter koreensis]|uniref:Glycosyltransferase n=1 Tax=Piscinibacter koreensis TaxID=2742824 RepID=A0A7Y6NM07_9BURK|nr:glycosyltransferase [Schlegelella koreensis]NUZ05564.1 glycosyltransferase [Schlegelella koreensis]
MTRPARDCHVVDTTMFWSPTGGGVRRYLHAKHAWLAVQPGWRHTIAVPRGSDPAAPEPSSPVRAVLPSLPIPGSGGYRLPVSRRAVAAALRDLEPDLVECGDPYRVAWGALDAAQALGVPAVAYCHSNLERMAQLAGGRWAGAAARRYAAHLYRHFDAVLAPSQSMTRHLRAWGVDRAECQPLGVDSALFHPARRARDARVALGVGDDARLLVFAGRFAPEKHLDVLAAAVCKLGARYVLLAVGAGPTPPPGSERVRIVPFVAGAPALAALIASADAFVHAGDQETFGLSVLEAMACGTPVIARRAEGLAELVDASVGACVDGGSADDFAAAIDAFFRDADVAACRAAARARAERHDWNRVLPELAARYQRLLDSGPERAPATAAGIAADAPLR